MHGGEQVAAENTSHTQHVEGVWMLCSAWNTSMKLKVPDAQGHAVREGTLTEGVDQEAAATVRCKQQIQGRMPRR